MAGAIHVAPGATGVGSAEDPCGFEQLQAVIERAQVVGAGDVTVEFADGRYEVGDTLRIRSLGSEGGRGRVRLVAAKDARPVLCGGRPISGWELHDESRNIWRAAVPSGADFEHLWWAHRRLVRAWSGWNPKGFRVSGRGLKMTAKGPRVDRWKNRDDIVVTVKMMWRKIPARIVGVDGDELCLDPHQTAAYRVPSTALGVMEPLSLYGLLNFIEPRRADYALENAYELLTDEGEWYLDRSTDTVYVKPFDDRPFGPETELTRPAVDTFILLDGTMHSPVSNLELDGLVFQYGKGTKIGPTAGFPTEPTAAITPTPKAALQINRGVGITVRNCRFFHLGYDALHFDLGGENYDIESNAFYDISRSAISLNQTNLVVSNRSKRGLLPENADKLFRNVRIHNNILRGSGIDAPAPAVSYSEFTRGLTFTHNEVSHCAIHAIRTSWRYLGWRGHCGDIEYAWNRTSDVGRDGLHDFGALYVSCSNAGYTRIHHNLVEGVGVNPNNAGIYLDVFVDGAEIHHNVSLDMPPERVLNRLSRGWVVLVMSTNTKVFNNWADQLSYRDFDQGRYRYFRHDPTNQLTNNIEIRDRAHLPPDAAEIAERAGLEPAFRHLREEVHALALGMP